MIKTRQYFTNYFLPSESGEVFRNMVGKEVAGIALGVLSSDINKEEAYFGFPYGGPIILSLLDMPTVVFNYDDLLNSVVLRTFHKKLQENDFFEELYKQDNYIYHFLQVKKIIPVDCFNGQKIERVSVFKYKDSLFRNIIKYERFHELLIAIQLCNKEEFIITCGFQMKYEEEGKALILDTYDDINPDMLKKLECLAVYD